MKQMPIMEIFFSFSHKLKAGSFLIAAFSILAVDAFALKDEDNQGRWNKPFLSLSKEDQQFVKGKSAMEEGDSVP